MIALGAALGLDLVAEGIESAEQVQILVDLGARIGQGYHLCRPLEIDALERWVAGVTGRGELPLAA